MRYWCRCCLVAAGLSLCACGSSPLLNEDMSKKFDTAFNQAETPPETYSKATGFKPTGLLTLSQAIALSLENAPALQAGRLHIQTMQAQAKYAGNWANPELEVELENFAGSGDFSGTQSLETTFSLAQSFPLGGDLAYMRRVAGHDAALAAWDQQALRLALLMQVTQQYIQAQTSQQQLVQSAQSLELVKEVHDVTRKRIDAGVSPQVELTRVAVEVSQMQMAHQQALRQRDAAMLQLALIWGQTQITFDQVQDNLAALQPLPQWSQLFELVEQNPQIARWATELSKRQVTYQLARAQMMPDLTARLGYRHSNDTGDHAMVAGVAIPLPVFDRNQSNRITARIGMQSAGYEKQQVRLQLLQGLNVAYTRMASFHDMATALKDDALPKARQAFALTRQAYQQGDVQYIDVIDAQKTLNGLQAQYLEALSEYHMAVAWIESMICKPLIQLGDSVEPVKP